MMKRHEFVEETIYQIRQLLEKKLPKEAEIEKFIEKRNKIYLKYIGKGGK